MRYFISVKTASLSAQTKAYCLFDTLLHGRQDIVFVVHSVVLTSNEKWLSLVMTLKLRPDNIIHGWKTPLCRHDNRNLS